MAAINSSGYGGPRLFYSLQHWRGERGWVHAATLDERHTESEIARHGRPRTGRGTLWPRNVESAKKKFRPRSKQFRPSFAFLCTVSLSVFISNRRSITSPSIGVLKFREQPRIEGIPILNKWSNKLNLFIHFSSPITTSKIENPCWSIPFWIKRKRIKNSINTYILVI